MNSSGHPPFSSTCPEEPDALLLRDVPPPIAQLSKEMLRIP